MEARITKLVKQIQGGLQREEAAAELYQLLHRQVHGFFLRLGFSAEEGRDLTQEVFIQVFLSIDNFSGSSSFKTWLAGITRHVYINQIRRRRTAKRDKVERALDDSSAEVERLEATSLTDALQTILDREQREALWAEVERMPEQMRACFQLRYEAEHKYSEIASEMKISVQTVKAHLHQARERLKKRLNFSLAGEEES